MKSDNDLVLHYTIIVVVYNGYGQLAAVLLNLGNTFQNLDDTIPNHEPSLLNDMTIGCPNTGISLCGVKDLLSSTYISITDYY